MKQLASSIATSIAVLCAIMFTINLVSGININEVMYNPLGDDNNQEFVEIYGTDNLTGYTIGDLESNDSLALLKFFKGEFSLIVEEGYNYSLLNCSIYSVGPTIGNNLNNDKDSVKLYENRSIVDSMSFDGKLANSNSRSLEYVNDRWTESYNLNGSPCLPNALTSYQNITQNSSGLFNQSNSSQNNTDSGQNTTTGIPSSNITDNSSHSQNSTLDESNETDRNSTSNENNISTSNSTSSNSSIKLEVIIPNKTYLGQTYTSLFKITRADYKTGEQPKNISVNYSLYYLEENQTKILKNSVFQKSVNYYAYSETGSIFLNLLGKHRICGEVIEENISACENFSVIDPTSIICRANLSLSTEKIVYENEERISIDNDIQFETQESFSYIIEYWIEDLFGEIFKSHQNTTNTNLKTFTPNIAESDKVLLIKNRLVFISCNNTNQASESEKLIIIKNNSSEIQSTAHNESSITIKKISPDGIYEFGQEIKVKLKIHKGNTAKTLISAIVKREKNTASEKSRIYIHPTNSDIELTIPVQLVPNCENKLSAGSYELIVEGLGVEEKQSLSISENKGKECGINERT